MSDTQCIFALLGQSAVKPEAMFIFFALNICIRYLRHPIYIRRAHNLL